MSGSASSGNNGGAWVARRRESWRRVGAGLAIAALLLQSLAVASSLPARVAIDFDAAFVCRSDPDGLPAPGDDGSEHGAACVLCQAVQSLAKAFPPAVVTVAPPRCAAVAIATPPAAPVPSGHRHYRQLPRGPPTNA